MKLVKGMVREAITEYKIKLTSEIKAKLSTNTLSIYKQFKQSIREEIIYDNTYVRTHV